MFIYLVNIEIPCVCLCVCFKTFSICLRVCVYICKKIKFYKRSDFMCALCDETLMCVWLCPPSFILSPSLPHNELILRLEVDTCSQALNSFNSIKHLFRYDRASVSLENLIPSAFKDTGHYIFGKLSKTSLLTWCISTY